MNRARRPPLQHLLAPVFDRAVDSFSVSLSSGTTRHYRGTVRNFLSYLGADHPEVQHLDQLHREPHILGWMSRLQSQVPPLVTASYILRLIGLRGICNELAWTEQLPELAHLIRREDIPRLPQRLPRPLTTEQDELLQQEFRLRNDLGGNAFLLIRHTGMRIGECADLSFDCLRSTGPNQWAVHRSANSKQNVWSPWIPLCVNSSGASNSFVSLIHCLPMDGFWPVRAPKRHSFVNSAITCIRSATRLAFSPASSPISFAIPMPRRCFELALACLR